MKILSWFKEKDSFIIGTDSFTDIQISPTPENDSFFYFYNTNTRSLVKNFILKEGMRVRYVCSVTLIKKSDKFTPRLCFSVRNKQDANIATKVVTINEETKTIKANIDLGDCYQTFWQLISFLQSLQEIEIPSDVFSLVTQGEAEIVTAIRSRGAESVIEIIKQLSATNGVVLSEKDINQLLNRKNKLDDFKNGLINHGSEEGWWQNFFEENKWIFGYGLNYQILRTEQNQPHYGGTQVNGKGGQRGDYLASTDGHLNFTVLVEIKTPSTQLLQGDKEVRSGAWSLSKALTDALSQIQANIDMWEKYGSEKPENRDRFESKGVHTIKPKGIIIIGSLDQLQDRNQRETFERFRKSIHGIDIITFDELYKRAEFIISNE